MKALDLKTKITLTVILVIVLFLSMGVYFADRFIEKQFKAMIARNQFLMVSAIANEIDSKLLTAHQQLIFAAGEVAPAVLRDPSKAQRFLDEKTNLQGFFDNHIGIFTPFGKEIAESPFTEGRRGRDFSYRQYFKNTVAIRKPVISEPYISSYSNHPAVMMTAPIMGPGDKLLGILVGSIDLMGDNILGDVARIKIGKEGYFSLTTADRIMVVHPDKSRIMKQIPAGNRLYDAAVAGYEGTDETVTTAGIPMVTSIQHMKVNRWIIVASYPQAEAYAVVHQMQYSILAGSAAAVMVIFLVISYLIGRFTEPLARFTSHVKQLSLKQGAEKQIQIGTNDEIGTLSRAFNTMVEDLDRRQEALRESENLFRNLAEKSMVGIYLIQNGVFRYVNPRFAEIFKYSSNELVDRVGPQDLTHPDDWIAVQEYISQRLHGEVSSVHYSFTGKTKQQENIDVEVYGSATVYQGEPAIIGTLLDITDRKRAEQSL